MQLTINDVAFGGKGVGRADGLAVFVPFTIPGEEVTVHVTRKKKNYAEAALVSIDTPSEDRVTPECPYFETCGGCSYQHIAYPRQLVIKSAQVEQTLRRVGKLSEVPMREIVPAPKHYEYRNRIRVHVADGKTGFFGPGDNTLIEIKKCHIASPEVNEKLAGLRTRPMPDGDYTLAEQHRKGFFEQTNPAVAKAMLKLVEGLLNPGVTLVDAYCGAGFFAQHLRGLFQRIVGIEENEFAIEHARKYAEEKEQYFAGDVSALLPEVMAEAREHGEVTLVLDPPAIGVTARVIDCILAENPREVIYVSCNPATLARDLSLLCKAYKLSSVTPLDMFPQTAEIEVVAHLQRI